MRKAGKHNVFCLSPSVSFGLSSDNMVFLEVILGVSLCLFGLVNWWQWSSRRFWKVNGVPYIPGIPFIGAFKEAFLFKKSIGELILDLYNDELTKNEPISGFFFFHKASLIIREPELIKRILVKDFNFFQDRFVASIEIENY